MRKHYLWETKTWYRRNNGISFRGNIGARHIQCKISDTNTDAGDAASIFEISGLFTLFSPRENKGTEREAPSPGLGICQFH